MPLSVRRTRAGDAWEARQRAAEHAAAPADRVRYRARTGPARHAGPPRLAGVAKNRGWPLIAVVGPTAAGKSDLAVDLALALGGEVINADSMQLYRGMDIGTAKLTQAERRGVPHHLLDVWDVTRTASAPSTRTSPRRSSPTSPARGKVPVLVGGSGLYIRAALGDLEFPGTDEAIRERLEAELSDAGPAPLYARLRAADPAAAAAILPGNGRRIVRALEVIELSGPPFQRDDARLRRGPPRDPARRPGGRARNSTAGSRPASTACGRPASRRRCGGLAACGLRDGRTASRALGYQQMLRYLDGDLTSEQARDETVRATRRFARRQESWFRRDPRVLWLAAARDCRLAHCQKYSSERVRNSASAIPPSDARRSGRFRH